MNRFKRSFAVARVPRSLVGPRQTENFSTLMSLDVCDHWSGPGGASSSALSLLSGWVWCWCCFPFPWWCSSKEQVTLKIVYRVALQLQLMISHPYKDQQQFWCETLTGTCGSCVEHFSGSGVSDTKANCSQQPHQCSRMPSVCNTL